MLHHDWFNEWTDWKKYSKIFDLHKQRVVSKTEKRKTLNINYQLRNCLCCLRQKSRQLVFKSSVITESLWTTLKREERKNGHLDRVMLFVSFDRQGWSVAFIRDVWPRCEPSEWATSATRSTIWVTSSTQRISADEMVLNESLIH